MHPWFSEDIFKKSRHAAEYGHGLFRISKERPQRKEGDDKTPEIQELQKAHIANIVRLSEAKKLVMPDRW